MKKKYITNKTVFILMLCLILINSLYYRIKLNTISDRNDYNSIFRLYLKLGDITDYYMIDNYDKKTMIDYFGQLSRLSLDISYSSRISFLGTNVNKIVDIRKDEVSQEEIDIVHKIRKELDLFIQEISEDINKKVRIFSIFNNERLRELNSITNI